MASPAKARRERPTPNQARAIPELATVNQAPVPRPEARAAHKRPTDQARVTQNGAGAGNAGEKGGGNGTAGGGTGDGELDKALKDFDGKILAERGTILARANEPRHG